MGEGWAQKEKTIISVSKGEKIISYQNISVKSGRFYIEQHAMVLR